MHFFSIKQLKSQMFWSSNVVVVKAGHEGAIS